MFTVRNLIFLILILLISGCTAWADNPPERIYDHGTYKGVAFNIDCQGAGISCSQSGITGTLTVSGGSSSGGGSGTVGIGTTGWNAYYASNGSTVTANSVIQTIGGNIGINNASPGQQLDVTGTVRATNLVKNGGTSSQFLKADGTVDSSSYLNTVTADSPLSGSGTSGSHLVLSTAGTWSGNAGTATALAANGTNCSAGNYPLGVDASGNSESCTAITSSQWATQNTTDVSLAGGNVGIGTTFTTTSALTVMNGNVGIGTWIPKGIIQIGSGNNGLFVTLGGNIGIGTFNPQNALAIGSTGPFQVNSSGSIIAVNTSTSNSWTNGAIQLSGTAATLQNASNGSNASLTIIGSSTATGGILALKTSAAGTSGDTIQFSGNSQRVMTIQGNGNNIGIGTTYAAGKLGILGNIGIGTVGNGDNYLTTVPPNGGMIIEGNVGVGTWTPSSLFEVGTQKFNILSGGNIGIGTINPPQALSISGVIGFKQNAPTISSCGSTPNGSVVGNDAQGTITIGGTATACTLAFIGTYAKSPHCTITNQSMSVTNAMTYTESVTGFVVSQAVGLSADLLDYHCTFDN